MFTPKYNYEEAWKVWKAFYYHPTLCRGGGYEPHELVAIFHHLTCDLYLSWYDAVDYMNTGYRNGCYLCQEYTTYEHIPCPFDPMSFTHKEIIHEWYTDYCEQYKLIMKEPQCQE